jgi:hypothetical protein
MKRWKVTPKRKILEYLNHLKVKQYENEHLFGMCEGLRIALHITAGLDMETFKLSPFPDEWAWQIREKLAEGVPKKEVIQISENAPASFINALIKGKPHGN